MLICNSWKCLVEIHHATSLTYHMIVRCFQNMNTFVVIRLIGPQSEGEKKEEKKRSVSKSNFDVVFLFSESEAAGGFKQLTGSCTARNPRQLSQLRRNTSNHHV